MTRGRGGHRSAVGDSTVVKVDSATSPKGPEGQRYLASGTSLSMRLWEAEPGGDRPEVSRDYETVGYVIDGRAELHLEGQVVILERGHSWVVPKGSSHTYVVTEAFTAVEATHPPAEVKGRDEPPA